MIARSRATDAFEICQVRKEAAIRRYIWVPRVSGLLKFLLTVGWVPGGPHPEHQGQKWPSYP